jgi:hypothetical protein
LLSSPASRAAKTERADQAAVSASAPVAIFTSSQPLAPAGNAPNEIVAETPPVDGSVTACDVAAG